jgi:hypothetical protein
MKKKKYHCPENDRNNVAYYKKRLVLKENKSVNLIAKVDQNLKQKPELKTKLTPSELPTSQTTKPSVWSLRPSLIEKRKTKIEPAFASMDSRVVVRVTHFNNKKFNGYITSEDAKHQIFQAIGLELANHHGMTFEREEEDKSNLSITFKLKHSISRDQLNRYFWYLKESSLGFDDTISGEVVYPEFQEPRINQDGTFYKRSVVQPEKIRLVKIEGCHYKLSETQIRDWLDLYGSVRGDVLEEAIVDEIDGALIGTGAYLAKVILSRWLPTWLPMFGLKIRLSLDGICKTCNNCFQLHKKEIVCEERKWEDFITEFRANNPDIDSSLINNCDNLD